MAKHELVFVSYATFPEQEVLSALREACGRDVDVTVVFERHVDNPTYAAIEDTKVPPTTSLDDLGAEPFLATHLFHPSRARPARGPSMSDQHFWSAGINRHGEGDENALRRRG
jgi:hypothetical protein